MAKNKTTSLRTAPDQDTRAFDASFEALSLHLVAPNSASEGALAANPQSSGMQVAVKPPESGLLSRLIGRIKTL